MLSSGAGMGRASYLQPRLNSSTRGSRGGALALTVLAHILLLLLLLTLAPPNVLRQAEPDALKTFNIAPEGTKAAPKARAASKHKAVAPPAQGAGDSAAADRREDDTADTGPREFRSAERPFRRGEQ